MSKPGSHCIKNLGHCEERVSIAGSRFVPAAKMIIESANLKTQPNRPDSVAAMIINADLRRRGRDIDEAI